MSGFGFGFGFSPHGALLNQATAPGISGIATSLVGDTGFTIGATVNPGGAETTVSIEYGLTAAYGSTQAVVTGSPLTSTGAISAALTGLSQNTLYHYRVKAVNSEGTTYSADATQTTTNVRWIIPITGRTSGTATAGTMVITMTEEETLSVTGDVTQSTAITTEGTMKRHTVTVNCPNNGSGTLIIPDRSKVISLGSHQGAADPTVNFYTGTNATAPILSLNINDIPATTQKIRQSTAYDNILPATGSSALPTGLTYFRFVNNQCTWSTASNLPVGLAYITINGDNINLTTLDFSGTGNVTVFELIDFRNAKLTSDEMVTVLTSLTNRVGSLPETIYINDYADYASPPSTVTDAVAALKAAKPSVTTVNLGA